MVPESDRLKSRVHDLGITSVQDLYEEIAAAFAQLDPAEVFVGNPERQVGSSVFSFKVRMATVTNRAEARAAITQVLAEGEGIGLNPISSDSHFQQFVTILESYMMRKDEVNHGGFPFDPVLPVVTNPWVGPLPQHGPVNPITAEPAASLVSLFNDAYTIMLVILHKFFATYSTSYIPEPRQQAALFYAAYFPLMTMVIRPLIEILVRIPAGSDYPGLNAGPSFQITGPLAGSAAPNCFDRLAELANRAREIASHCALPHEHAARLRYIADNLISTQRHAENSAEFGS
jgi:Ferritin-like